jgi:hypothetical protein
MITLFGFSQFDRGKIINVPDDFTTIQEAINAAHPNDMVLVAEGTYYENIRFCGKPITVASRFILDGVASHINNTIIRGAEFSPQNMGAVVMFVDGEDTTSVLNGFTITGGHGVKNETYQLKCGGGIYTNNSGSKIINNIIIGNNLNDELAAGAGICCITDDGGSYWTLINNNLIKYNNLLSNGYASFGGGVAIMINSVIRNNLFEFNTCKNTNHQAYGGAIEIQKLTENPLVSIIENNTVRHNKTEGINGSFGAGIATSNISPTVTGNVFTDNKAISSGTSKGGAIYVFKSDEGIILRDNRFENNVANGDISLGGAVAIQQTGRTEILNNEFFRSTANANAHSGGGALWLTYFNDAVDIQGNTFRLNQASGISLGGAIGIVGSQDYLVKFDRNIVSENTAREGAGLWVYNMYNINLYNNVFSQNDATYLGGAIRFSETDSDAVNNFFTSSEMDSKIVSRAIYRPAVSNNNFVKNSAFKGGSIYTDLSISVPVVFNSIFCSNSAMVGLDVLNESDVELAIYNCLIDTERISCPWNGMSNILCDPLLEGDCTHLCWESECANAGISALYYDYTLYKCAELDIDLEERPYYGTNPDIGADETPVMFVDAAANERSDGEFSVFPNPVETVTTIEFELDKQAYVEISVYNASGEMLETIQSSFLTEGIHFIEWNSEGRTAGIYSIRLNKDKFDYSKNIVVLR